MSGIFNSELDSILEGTSRSFYLSLKELPRAIRPQVSLLYMLARNSDTIADSEGGEPRELLEALESYDDFTQGRSSEPPTQSSNSEDQTKKSKGPTRNQAALESLLKGGLFRLLEWLVLSGYRFIGSDRYPYLSDRIESDRYPIHRIGGARSVLSSLNVSVAPSKTIEIVHI